MARSTLDTRGGGKVTKPSHPVVTGVMEKSEEFGEALMDENGCAAEDTPSPGGAICVHSLS
jgi:hypothetical protein